MMKEGYRSGFAAVIGRPNVGKSTLINTMVGEKISIISDKPQTTRNSIRAIYTTGDFQLVFIDTPGIHKPKNKLGDYMVKIAQASLNEVDVIVYVVEAGGSVGRGDENILEMLKGVKTPIILAINKVDLVDRDRADELVEKFRNRLDFSDIIPISAVRGDNLNILRGAIVEKLPEGPQYFPDDMVTDHPEKFIVSEIVREKALNLLDQEVPHGIAVEVEQMEEDEGANLIRINANLYCERESHKRIIIGKGGHMLKRIGTLARVDLENLFGCRIYLNLWVKVKKDWRDVPGSLHMFGYQ
ncbi:MAG: GTP-binding protein Era [Firmicutes bacterium]|nr:GTP-binding protein Era [Bacillota bacterium]MDI6706741.1 GTPase Era [Bacillota bacterium]